MEHMLVGMNPGITYYSRERTLIEHTVAKSWSWENEKESAE